MFGYLVKHHRGAGLKGGLPSQFSCMAVQITQQDVEIAELSLRASTTNLPKSKRKYVKGRSIYLGVMKGGISTDTLTPHGTLLCEVFNGILRNYIQELPFEWCSLVINYNTQSKPHKDSRNKVGLMSVIGAFGSFTGGGDLQFYEADNDEMVPVGEPIDIHNKLLMFDGRRPVSYTHLTLPTNREV